MIQKWKPNSYFSLFENCKIVKGITRSMICDLQREKYFFIPNSLYDLINEYNGKKKEDILKIHGRENCETINEYFDFLHENEFIFWISRRKDLNMFTPLNLAFDLPSIVSNAIFQISNLTVNSLQRIIKEFEELNCQDIQFQFECTKQLDCLEQVFICTELARIRSIEIYLKWNNDLNIDNLELLIEKYPRIRILTVHSSPSFYLNSHIASMGMLFYTTEKIDFLKSCGLVHWDYFNTNIKLFTEAQQHNTCLNRKISIDVNGEIKNCPSMTKSYGNIKDTTLAEAIEKPGFKDLWFINKDKIHVCKDCEFRYICTDCRAYIENPEDIYSKPLKCGYNPYTAEWEEWSTNPLKQKAIEFYGMQDLVKKDN